MPPRLIVQSVALFLLAGLLEIGGGYLVWLWLRESRGWLLGALSILWGWWGDAVRPERPEIAGALLCLVGVAVIMYWPRP